MARGGRNPLVVILTLLATASFLTLGLILVDAAEVSMAHAASGDWSVLGGFVKVGLLVIVVIAFLGVIRGLLMDAV